jgi:HEPN domain-containing protein
MNAIVEEWIRKADADFGTASREAAVVDGANFDAVCFHAQQCIEKLMKAAMIGAGHTPPRLHDLAVLSRTLEELIPGWSWPDDELRFLTRAAVEYRYPGESANADDAAEALDVCRRVRTELLSRMQP